MKPSSLAKASANWAALYAGLHLLLYVADQKWNLWTVASEIVLRFYLTVGFVVATFWGPARPILGALVALYLASAIVATLVVGRNSPPRTRWTLPAVFATMHITYGLGMFGGLARVVSRAVSKGPSQG